MTPERESIDRAQAHLLALKAEMETLEAINREAGRDAAGDDIRKLTLDLERWHIKATGKLRKNFPEFSAEVIAQGGGGR